MAQNFETILKVFVLVNVKMSTAKTMFFLLMKLTCMCALQVVKSFFCYRLILKRDSWDGLKTLNLSGNICKEWV